MSNNTKDRILDAALEIFSRDGYAGTNLKDIAESVGVVKSAFYRHFASKEEVWDAVLDKMEAYYNERFSSPEHLSEIPKSCDELFQLTMNMVDFTIHDEKIIMTRKLLLTEQFHDERVKKLASEHFTDGTKAIFRSIFEKMTENGVIKKVDADFLSLSYTAPITALIHLCDREPEQIPEAVAKIETFSKQFIDIYGVTQ